MSKRIGFFGGCFNPVTSVHIDLIKEVINKENLSKVYFVPMGDLYQKQDLISLEDRKNMLKLAFDNNDKFDILDISNKDKKTYAIDTFRKIDEIFPEDERFFIMGTDNFNKMSTWKNQEELKNYKYILLDRKKENTKDISSTLVRNKIKNGESLEGLVPEQVIKYIKENDLYK